MGHSPFLYHWTQVFYHLLYLYIVYYRFYFLLQGSHFLCCQTLPSPLWLPKCLGVSASPQGMHCQDWHTS